MENADSKIVISASRRTDIPAFYLDWFMDRIERGFFEVANPFNGRVSIVPATPARVHSVVFWSKDFGPFLSRGIGEQLQQRGYHLFFNFTINSADSRLEPGVPPLDARLDQLEQLCRRFDPRVVQWRFDPICCFSRGDGATEDNLQDFESIARRASKLGICRCVTSFMDHYPKIQKRIPPGSGFRFQDPLPQTKRKLLTAMARHLAQLQMELATCCEKEILDGLPADAGIKGASCVPNHRLMKIYGGRIATRSDSGQRLRQGCGCKVSADIGSYRDHPCYHNCLFCYANPAGDAHDRIPGHRDKNESQNSHAKTPRRKGMEINRSITFYRVE